MSEYVYLSETCAVHPTVENSSRFLRRENDHDIRAHQDITGPLMAQYLLALLGREQTGRGDPFSELLGIPRTGQLGDYVFNQEG
jgi:E3 ubiquitin-protein ligase RNF115/126